MKPYCWGVSFTYIANRMLHRARRTAGMKKANRQLKYVMAKPASGYMIMPPRNAKASKNPMNSPQRLRGIHLKRMLHPGDQPIASDTALIAQNMQKSVMLEARPKAMLEMTAPTAP